jgi:hypothetical protein
VWNKGGLDCSEFSHFFCVQDGNPSQRLVHTDCTVCRSFEFTCRMQAISNSFPCVAWPSQPGEVVRPASEWASANIGVLPHSPKTVRPAGWYQ